MSDFLLMFLIVGWLPAVAAVVAAFNAWRDRVHERELDQWYTDHGMVRPVSYAEELRARRAVR